MIIGIVGVGVVGGAVKYGMEKLGHEVKVHDIKWATKLEDLLDTDLCFICVPTPQGEDGSCDSRIVEQVVYELTTEFYRGVIAIKSTVSPGTTRYLVDKIRSTVSNSKSIHQYPKVCFVPEFLRERCAISDFTENHDVCVVGVDTGNKEIDETVYNLVVQAHGKYPQKFARMTPTEAELTKYFSNVYNAMRVTFANGFYDVCQKIGADYSKIKNAVVERPTILDLYLDCNEKFRGFAGVCLPKDTAAFANLAEDLGVKAQIFRTIVDDNKLYRPTVSEGMRLE